MRLLPWDALPDELRCEAVRPYYETLAAKRAQLAGKRCFDNLQAAQMHKLHKPEKHMQAETNN